MPDEYGGIELEDQWGGVAVEEEPAPPQPELPEGYTRYIPLPGELEALKAYQPSELRPSTLTPEEIDAGGAAFRAELEAKQRRDWGLEVEAAMLAKEQKTDTLSKAITAAPINIATGLEGVGAQLGGVISGLATASEMVPWMPHPISIPPVRRFVKEQGDLMRKEFGELAQENRRDIEGLGQDTAGKAIGRLTETAAGSVPAIPAAILGGIPAAAVVAGGQSFGSTFNEAAAAYEKSGLDKESAESKALLPATASGVATALITAAGGRTGVESIAKLGGREGLALVGAKNLKEIAVNVFRSFTKHGVAEGSEEGGDQATQAIIQMATYNPDLTFGEVVKQVTEAAVMGGVLGGTAGGIVSGIEARRAMVPPEIRARIEQAKQTGLTKAAAAAEEAAVKGADAIQKAEAKAPIEEGAGVELRQEATQEAPLKPRLVPVLETASGKLYPGPSHTKAAEAARAKINSDFAEGKITREEFIKELTEVLEADEAVDTQHKMLDLNTGKTVEQGPGRVQSFNLDPKETAANLKELQEKGIKTEAPKDPLAQLRELPGTSNTTEAMALGKKVPPEAIPELEAIAKAAADDANRVMAEVDALPNPTEADLTRMSVAGNRSQLLTEAVEAAKGGEPAILARDKATNETAKTATTKEAPAPELAAEGVGAIPENIPTARPAIAQEGVGGGSGITEPQRAIAFLERESEAQGLGRSSLPPTVEDVRAQRARDAGKPPSPPKPPTQGATPSPDSPKSSLDDVYGIFETDPKPSPTIKQRVIKASEAFRTGLSSSFRPLNKLVEDIAKQYGLPLKKADLAGLFEQLKGSSGKAEADIYRFDQDVSKLVKGSEKDFNAHLFLRRSLDRLEQDVARGETRRAVSGYTIPELQSKLATLEAKLTPEQRASFKTASDSFQRHMDEALKLQVDSGRMSPEVYAAIKEGNQFYAPFKVMKYLEETSRPAGTGRRIDTPASFVKAMEGIESPDFKLGDMLAAARQNISLSRVLAEKNKAMQNFTDLAALDTEGLFLKKLKGQEAPQGMEAVNVFENGVQERYGVNSAVAEAINAMGPKSSNILLRMASSLFRAGVTTFNIPFQVSNLLADTPRAALMSRYGVNILPELVMYPFDAIYAKAKGIPVSQVNKRLAASAMQSLRFPLSLAEAVYSSITGDVIGAKNKLMLDFMDSGVAGTTMQEYLTPGALRPKEGPFKGVKNVLKTPLELAKAIEQINKITGVRQAMKAHGVDSGKLLPSEAVTELRRFSGSPDFGRLGKWTEQYGLNVVQVFFNARVQGLVADAGRLAGRDGARAATSAWINLMAYVGVPSLYLYLNNNRDEESSDNYGKRPEQEKRNYWLVPKQNEDGSQKYITGAGGEKIPDYWRIPKRESAKWMANFTEAAMDFAKEKNPEAFKDWSVGTLEDMSPVNIQGGNAQERLESVGSGLNPFIKAPLEVATGRDMYRHRNIIPETMKKASPEQQYTDRTGEAFKQLAELMPDVAPEVFRSPLMLENLTKNITGGLITQFMPQKPIEGREGIENNPLLRRFQAVPYTDSSEFDERMDKLERETADEQLTRFRNADKLLKENKGVGIKVLVQKSVAAYGPDLKQAEKVVDLWTAEQRGITPQERRIMALPTQQRAEFIIGELTGKTPEQRAAIIRSYGIKRILTEGVAEQMIAQGFK